MRWQGNGSLLYTSRRRFIFPLSLRLPIRRTTALVSVHWVRVLCWLGKLFKQTTICCSGPVTNINMHARHSSAATPRQGPHFCECVEVIEVDCGCLSVCRLGNSE